MLMLALIVTLIIVIASLPSLPPPDALTQEPLQWRVDGDTHPVELSRKQMDVSHSDWLIAFLVDINTRARLVEPPKG